ncbi:P-loop NTPase fold protein [Lichenihabitans psoromatis]|uniref:P-loop NTPase fold protein n=1 Tax=Lichenihabitans psoromatis TaxID=2528642 RepID=UPI0013F1763C|nr:P-loop NTPase fold protein [Lichenihabitans psoromatis]
MSSADIAVRDPGFPIPAGVSSSLVRPPDASRAMTPIAPLFSADLASGEDELGRGEQAVFMAELLAHQQVETPFCVGVFGSAGAGKSFFLNHTIAAVKQASDGAARVGAASPFLPDILTVQVEASSSTDAGATLMVAVAEALAISYPASMSETLHAGGDPVKAARDSSDSLNDARRRLDEERQTLDGLVARQARLVETVLFEAAGPRVDAYARGNRSRIEAALRSFGFTGADPVLTYKDLVREASEASAPLSRFALGLRALWAYPGQTRLIVYAILFGLLAWGATALQTDQQAWLTWIADFGDRAVPTADWLRGHVHWLGPIHTVALTLAILALVWNVLRAARFLQPIFKGVSLLRYDLEARHRDLKGQLAHQTRRVDGLASDAEAASVRAAASERRASQHISSGLHDASASALLPADAAPRDSAATFFRSLGALMARGTVGAAAGMNEELAPGIAHRDTGVPRRIVVAIDGLDRLAADAAASFVTTARRLLGPGFVIILAADRGVLASGFSETDPARSTADLGRSVNLSYHLGLPDRADLRATYARRLIEGGSAATPSVGDSIDPRLSALDAAWRPKEAETVAALASFAGENPRAIKQFVNVYRIARADPQLRDAPTPVFTALALALALDSYGFPEDLAALESASHGEMPRDSAVLRQALAAARAASGEPVELGQAQRGLEVARHYTSRT